MPARHSLPSGVARDPRPSLPLRLLWFVALWAGSVALLGAIGYAIKLWLGA